MTTSTRNAPLLARRERLGGVGDRGAGEPVALEHAIPDAYEHLDLVVRDEVVAEALDDLQVGRIAALGGGLAFAREHRIGRAAVVGRDLAPDEAVLLRPRDQAG